MKRITGKLIQAAIVILLSWIFVHGVGYAHSTCCSINFEDCIPTAEGITGHLEPSHCPVDSLIDFYAGNTCYINNRYEYNGETANIKPFFQESSSLFHKVEKYQEVAAAQQYLFAAERRLRPFRNVSIYLLKQSLIF